MSTKTIQFEGYTTKGDRARTIELIGPDGMKASILTLGARLLDLKTASGRQLVLPLTSLQLVEDDGAYIGVAVGRTANRIRGGCVRVGVDLPDLEKNDNSVNHIHGGRNAWDKRLFSVRARGPNWVVLYLFSPDGDQGYPGALDVEVRYELRGAGALCVDLSTRNVSDVPTIVNMTVHPYFDLSGQGGRAADVALSWVVHAERCGHHLPLDNNSVPTGAVDDVGGTPYDFRKPRAVGALTPEGGGFDNYLLRINHDPRTAQLEPLVSVEGDGIRLDVNSNQPGFQIYTANGFDGREPYGFARRGSIAIEPSMYIDAANHPSFPSIELAPGASRTQSISYVFSES